MIVSEVILYFWYSIISVSSVIIAFVIPSTVSLSKSNNIHHWHFNLTCLLNTFYDTIKQQGIFVFEKCKKQIWLKKFLFLL